MKIGLSLAIVAWLLYRAANDKAFADLCSQPKNWWLLAGSTVVGGMAVVLTHIRWCYLVRALGLPMSMHSAFRLGSAGYLFNLAPLGVVGGDLLKAVMLVKQLGGHHAKATASVLVDRVLGLYLLLIVASVAIVCTGYWQVDPRVSAWTFAATALGGFALWLLHCYGTSNSKLLVWLERLPKVGGPLKSLADAVSMYRNNYRMLLTASALTIGTHLLYSISLWLIGCALYERVPNLSWQFVIVPLAAATGVIPLAVGPLEIALELFYVRLGMPEHQGLIVALASRLVTLLVASLGMLYYLASRREIVEDLEAVDELPPTAPPPPARMALAELGDGA